jgi:hypothetical protein
MIKFFFFPMMDVAYDKLPMIDIRAPENAKSTKITIPSYFMVEIYQKKKKLIKASFSLKIQG